MAEADEEIIWPAGWLLTPTLIPGHGCQVRSHKSGYQAGRGGFKKQGFPSRNLCPPADAGTGSLIACQGWHPTLGQGVEMERAEPTCPVTTSGERQERA